MEQPTESEKWEVKIGIAVGEHIGTSTSRAAFAKETMYLLKLFLPKAVRNEDKHLTVPALRKAVKNAKTAIEELYRAAEKSGPDGQKLLSKCSHRIEMQTGCKVEPTVVIDYLIELWNEVSKLTTPAKKRGIQITAQSTLAELIAGLYWNHFETCPTTVKSDPNKMRTPFDRICDTVNDLLVFTKRAEHIGRINDRARIEAISLIKNRTERNKTFKFVPLL